MVTNTKKINFDEEMERDLEEMREEFKKRFNILPSNTALMNVLLQTYKNSKPNITKKPKTKKTFMIEI